MPEKIFVNLPVRDLAKSVGFYEAMGARRDPDLSGDHAAMMGFSDSIIVMLLTHEFFAGFTTKRIADAHDSTEVLICLSADNRAEVDRTVAQAAAAGGRTDPHETKDHGFMYGRSYEDPDGHIFQVTWTDFAAARAAMRGQAAEA
jgi:predicted lactoylglutathione lyase